MPRASAGGRPAEVRTHATSSHILMQNLACNGLLLGETHGFGNRSTSQAALSSPTCPCCLTARKNVHTSFSCRWRFRSDLQSYNPPSFEKRSGPGRYLCELMAEQPRPSTCNSNGNSNSNSILSILACVSTLNGLFPHTSIRNLCCREAHRRLEKCLQQKYLSDSGHGPTATFTMLSQVNGHQDAIRNSGPTGPTSMEVCSSGSYSVATTSTQLSRSCKREITFHQSGLFREILVPQISRSDVGLRDGARHFHLWCRV